MFQTDLIHTAERKCFSKIQPICICAHTRTHMITKVTNAKTSHAEGNAQKRLSATKWQQANKFACAYACTNVLHFALSCFNQQCCCIHYFQHLVRQKLPTRVCKRLQATFLSVEKDSYGILNAFLYFWGCMCDVLKMHENNWKNSYCVCTFTHVQYAHVYHIATAVHLSWTQKMRRKTSDFVFWPLFTWVYISFSFFVVASCCWLATQATNLQMNLLWFFTYFTYESYAHF